MQYAKFFPLTVILTITLTSISVQSQPPLLPSPPQKDLKTEHYESGAIHFEYTYVEGQLDGLTREYYETGEVKSEKNYEKGKLVFQRDFRNNGQLEYEMKYDSKANKNETQIEYYPSGELHNQRTLVNGKREGLEIEYYQNGQKKAERNYKNGKKDGNAKGYYNNGNLQGDWEFKEGSPVAATIYYRSGEKWLVHKFTDGKLNGITKEYDKDGKLIAERIYKNDQLLERRRVTSWW